MLTNEILKKFVELDKKKDEYKKFLEEYKEYVNEVADILGIDGHFQDDDGTVYQVSEMTGKFVYFDRIDIKRTRREGERSGSLSLKKAEELGYTVKK